MALYHRIPSKYLVLIPALYFAGVGSFDIISDAIDHKLTMGNFLFNAALFAPLVLRHWLVYTVSGVLAGMFAVYGFFALFVWLTEYMGGAHFRYAFDTFVFGPVFAAITLLCGLSLVYAGIRLSPNRTSLRAH